MVTIEATVDDEDDNDEEEEDVVGFVLLAVELAFNDWNDIGDVDKDDAGVGGNVQYWAWVDWCCK